MDFKEFGLGAIAMMALITLKDVLKRVLPNRTGDPAKAEIAALKEILDKILHTLDMFAAGTNELPSLIRSTREIVLDLVSRHENITKEGLGDIREQLKERFDRLEGILNRIKQ